MFSLVAAFLVLKRRRDFLLGKDKRDLEVKEEMIENVKKANNAISSLDEHKRRRLRERYKYK